MLCDANGMCLFQYLDTGVMAQSRTAGSVQEHTKKPAEGSDEQSLQSHKHGIA